MVIVENIIPRSVISNLSCALVVNYIPLDDIFDYYHIRESNIYIMPMVETSTQEESQAL